MLNFVFKFQILALTHTWNNNEIVHVIRHFATLTLFQGYLWCTFEFSIHAIMTFASSFMSSFPICMHFVSFLCVTALSSNSTIILKSSGEKKTLPPFPNLRENCPISLLKLVLVDILYLDEEFLFCFLFAQFFYAKYLLQKLM